MQRRIGCYRRSEHRKSLTSLKFDVIRLYVHFRFQTAFCLCKSVKNWGLGLGLVGLGLVVDIPHGWADSGR